MDMATAGLCSAAQEHHIGISTPLPRYTGFPWWHALLAAPGHERDVAERLQRYRVTAYLPLYSEKVRIRGGRAHRHEFRAVVGGMLFVPVEMMDVPRLHEMLERCGVHDFWRDGEARPTKLAKPVIERIREMEAELNLHVSTRQLVARRFKIGMEVRFTDDVLADCWGTGTVAAIDRNGRITVDVAGLLGRTVPIVVPAAKIEAM